MYDISLEPEQNWTIAACNNEYNILKRQNDKIW